MPSNRLTKQKVMTMNEIVQGQLFKDTECRKILLPHILEQLRILLEENQEVCLLFLLCAHTQNIKQTYYAYVQL